MGGFDQPSSPRFAGPAGRWLRHHIIHTRDGGQNWTRQTGGTVPNIPFSGVYAVDAQTAWACGAVSAGYGTILRTIAGGTWENHSLPVASLDANGVWWR